MKKVKSKVRIYQYRVNLDLNLYLKVSAANHEQAEEQIHEMSLEEMLDKTVMHDHHTMRCLNLDECTKIN